MVRSYINCDGICSLCLTQCTCHTLCTLSLLTYVHRNTLRKSRGAALEGISGAREGQQVFVGKKNKDFAFTDLPCRVTFVACSARGSQAEGSTSEADIQNVKDWIAQLA